MYEPIALFRKGPRSAEVKKVTSLNGKDVQYQYKVWDTREGFIAAGYRETPESAIKAAKVGLRL